MVGVVKFLCYANGNIQNGDDGAYYDQGPVKRIRLNNNATYEQLYHLICTTLRIDPATHQVTIFHRHPRLSTNQGDKVYYVLVPIVDDEDVLSMIEFTEDVGSTCCQELYIETSNKVRPPEHESQRDDVTPTSTGQVLHLMNVASSTPQNHSSPVHEQEGNHSLDNDNHVEADGALRIPPVDTYEESENVGSSQIHSVQALYSLEEFESLDSGPSDRSVLHCQDKHRSVRVWEGQNTWLTCRRREASLRRGEDDISLDPRMMPFIEQAGFIGLSRLPFIQLDWHLITALVERWRPETHTFHMPHGETTVTLEDVSIQLGLPVDGDVVTGSTSLGWADECERLLGLRPGANDIKGARVSLLWLSRSFRQLPAGADNETIKRHARAYILQLIGGILFADKSQSLVHLMFLPLLENFETTGRYSWGSACLAWLYRQLCRAAQLDAQEIGGPLIFLQIWAWDRFPHIAPIRRNTTIHDGHPLACRWKAEFDVTHFSTHVVSHYRDALDRQTLDQIVWQPYSKDIVACLPSCCRAGHEIWLARVPLICFHIVEWYFPDRVMRQFGGYQRIPAEVDTEQRLHGIDLRGKTESNWVSDHAVYIRMWQERRDRLIKLEPVVILGDKADPAYGPWFRRITRRYIGRTGAVLGYLGDVFAHIHAMSAPPRGPPDVHALAVAAMRVVEGNSSVTLHPTDISTTPNDLGASNPSESRLGSQGRGRRRGRGHGRERGQGQGRMPEREHGQVQGRALALQSAPTPSLDPSLPPVQSPPPAESSPQTELSAFVTPLSDSVVVPALIPPAVKKKRPHADGEGLTQFEPDTPLQLGASHGDKNACRITKVNKNWLVQPHYEAEPSCHAHYTRRGKKKR